MSDRATAEHALIGVPPLSSMVTIPELVPVTAILQEIYITAQDNHVRSFECKVLAGYASAIVWMIYISRGITNQSDLSAVSLLTEKATKDMRTDIRQWKNYPPGMAYFSDPDILCRMELRHRELNQALRVIGAASTFKQADWSRETVKARSEDQVFLWNMNLRQTDLHRKVDELKKPLARRLRSGSRGTWDCEEEVDRVNIMQQISQLRSGEFGFLTPGNLEYEVQKVGKRPFHSSSMYELWKGTWLDKYAVAMKVFRGKEFEGQPTEGDRARIDRQVGVWRSLRHQNVLQCCGIVLHKEGDTNGTSICSVIPWLPNRDVMRYLEAHPEANRTQLIHDVAKGLQYLHGVGIQHNALQGSNVLVDDEKNAVLSDFSLTKTLDPNAVMTRTGSGPSLRWSAPETISDQILSIQADVYSWGMTALEILSGLEPYHGIVSTRQLMNTIMQHLTPRREDYTRSASLQDNVLWSLLLSCWEADSDKRPTMDEVVERLEAMRFGLVPLSDTTHHIPIHSATGAELPRDHSVSSSAIADYSKESIPSAPGPSGKRYAFARLIKTIGAWIC